MLKNVTKKWRYGKSPLLDFFYEGDLNFQNLTPLFSSHVKTNQSFNTIILINDKKLNFISCSWSSFWLSCMNST